MICIKVIPHASQRYPTAGDWFRDAEGALQIRVSKMSDRRYELLVAVHELVEVILCDHDGVSEKSVDAFDIAFEKMRQPGDESEPGDHPLAPYHRQHCIATGVERILAALLGVEWKVYEREVNDL